MRWLAGVLAGLFVLLASRPTAASPLGGTTLESTYGYPARQIAFLNAVSAGGGEMCSGALVGPNVVLTAAHCLTPGGQVAKWVEVAPGHNYLENPFGTQRSSSFYLSRAWRQSRDPNGDWALVKLPDDSVGRRLGWLELDTSAPSPGFPVALQGYPSLAAGRQWRGEGHVYMEHKGSFYHSIPPVVGVSGGPIMNPRTNGIVAVQAYIVPRTLYDHATGMGPAVLPAMLAELQDGCAQLGCEYSFASTLGAQSPLRPPRWHQVVLPMVGRR